jgi:ribonuclease HI
MLYTFSRLVLPVELLLTEYVFYICCLMQIPHNLEAACPMKGLAASGPRPEAPDIVPIRGLANRRTCNSVMDLPGPHYLLFARVDRDAVGRWQFVLRREDGSGQFEAADVEPATEGERLELLTVVRALEALDQPSRVTLVTCGDYVRNGVQYGLAEWKNNGWRWEFFGQMVPVKHCDLWQRMDQALRFHRVECRQRRFDTPHSGVRRPFSAEKSGVWGLRVGWYEQVKYSVALAVERWRGRIVAAVRPIERITIRRSKRCVVP